VSSSAVQFCRRIKFWLDDLQLLMSLVRSGQALDDSALVRLYVSDCPYECVEKIWLVWRPAIASG
jgi:hypothetical protein